MVPPSWAISGGQWATENSEGERRSLSVVSGGGVGCLGNFYGNKRPVPGHWILFEGKWRSRGS